MSYNQSSIHLPGEAFSSSPDSRAITSVLLTLNDVLPLDKETKDKKQAVTANTTVVSSTVYPRPPNVFKQPVKIVLENKRVINPLLVWFYSNVLFSFWLFQVIRFVINLSTNLSSDFLLKVNVPAEVNVKRKCVFWRPGGGGVWQTNGCRLVAEESNVSITTCECNHLTVFASLMDPHDAPVSKSETDRCFFKKIDHRKKFTWCLRHPCTGTWRRPVGWTTGAVCSALARMECAWHGKRVNR